MGLALTSAISHTLEPISVVATPFTVSNFEKIKRNSSASLMVFYLLGILHHLDDDACNHLLTLTASVLAPKGRVIALDTVVHDGQNKFEHLFSISDRGNYVRRPDEFMALANRAFWSVDDGVEKTRWVPSTACYMILSEPKVFQFT
jgi:hypothetical protein